MSTSEQANERQKNLKAPDKVFPDDPPLRFVHKLPKRLLERTNSRSKFLNPFRNTNWSSTKQHLRSNMLRCDQESSSMEVRR